MHRVRSLAIAVIVAVGAVGCGGSPAMESATPVVDERDRGRWLDELVGDDYGVLVDVNLRRLGDDPVYAPLIAELHRSGAAKWGELESGFDAVMGAERLVFALKERPDGKVDVLLVVGGFPPGTDVATLSVRGEPAWRETRPAPNGVVELVPAESALPATCLKLPDGTLIVGVRAWSSMVERLRTGAAPPRLEAAKGGLAKAHLRGALLAPLRRGEAGPLAALLETLDEVTLGIPEGTAPKVELGLRYGDAQHAEKAGTTLEMLLAMFAATQKPKMDWRELVSIRRAESTLALEVRVPKDVMERVVGQLAHKEREADEARDGTSAKQPRPERVPPPKKKKR